MDDSDSRDRPTKPSSSRQPPSHRPERPLRGELSSSHPDPAVHRHHEARAEGHHYVPKMSFPLFDGSNPKIWIDKCTHYFQIQNISESSWVLAASLHMDGNASKWWQACKLKNGMGTWEQFVQAVQKFDSFDYKHAIYGLIELQQTGSVRDYVDEFEALQFQITSRAEKNSFKNSVMSGTAAHEVFDEMLFEDDTTTMAEQVTFSAPGASQTFAQMVFYEMCVKVTWDEMQDDIDTHEGLLQQLALGVDDENTKGSAYVLLDGMSSQDVAQEVYDEMLGKIVWDEEMSANLDVNNNLLQLLASSGGYQDNEQIVDGFPGFMELGLVDSDQGFVEELDEDSKPVCEADMDDELTLERNTPFLLRIVTDDVNETPVNVNSHDGLSQQLASAREYVYHEKMIPTVQLDFGLSPTISIQDEMGVGSYTRMPKQALILKIGKHHFGYGNGSIIALEKNDSAA